MATTYTITLNSGEDVITSVDQLKVLLCRVGDWTQDNYHPTNPTYQNYITRITPPTCAKGYRRFLGYLAPDGYRSILADGTIDYYCFTAGVPATQHHPTSDETWTAEWEYTVPVCKISTGDGTGGTSLLYFNTANNKWYLDYPFATEFNSSHPITLPTQTMYKFLGCYATNATSGTKYINEDGTPTSAFLALRPSSDITIYAQWQKVSYKVTVNHSSGSPTSTVFWYRINGGGFYADDLCLVSIDRITPPERSLYRWNGAFSSSTQSAANRYINSDGTFTTNLTSLTLTANKTISYANYWTQVSYKITLYGTTWAYLQNAYYTDKTNGGIFADWLCETTALDYLPIPTRGGYRFIGYYSTNATTGTQYADGNGLISSTLKTKKATLTLYPQGRAATYTLTFNANGGTTNEPTLYYDATSGSAAFFGTNSATKTSVEIPTYTGNTFLGYFTAQTGGTQVVDANGNILAGWTPTANATVYAQWTIDVSIIDIDNGEATTEGTTRFWYKGSTRKFYSDAALTVEITAINVPTKRLHNLNGIYTENNVLAVNSSGVIQSGFTPSGEFVNIHATYTRRCYEMRLSLGGGSLPVSAIYRAPGGSTWYKEDTLTTTITNVGVPIRSGYTFANISYGGSVVISSTGNIQTAARIDADYTASATWTANTYTLYFNGNGATPSFSSKQVTYGSAIGNLPTVSYPRKTFESWKIGDDYITSATVWKYATNQTAIAAWESFFGNVKDWFNLANGALVPIASDSGDNKQRICYSHTGKIDGAETSSGVWRNPRVTYVVKANTTVNVTLGKAYKASSGVSGYMIVAVTVETRVGQFPTVTVEAVANEGSDAINKWNVAIPVVARSKAQNLLNGVNGGGRLNACSITACCDPVVIAENMMPCASDIVAGRIELTATTITTSNESEPTATNGFTAMGAPKVGTDAYYTTYNLTAQKEL